VWDDSAAKLTAQGLDPASSPQTYRDLATWINRASGKGDASLLDLAPPIRDAIFAPQLTASRLELLNPSSYVNLSAPVRKMALKQVATAVGAGMGVLALAARSGMDVGSDPESADFGKVVSPDGKIRYEVFAGFTPFARLAALTMTGKFDKVEELAGKRGEALLSPMHSLAFSAFRGKNFQGEPFDPLSETGNRFIPLALQDMRDAVREEGFPAGVLAASPSLVGVGVQAYSKKKAKPGHGNR